MNILLENLDRRDRQSAVILRLWIEQSLVAIGVKRHTAVPGKVQDAVAVDSASVMNLEKTPRFQE